MSNQSNEAFSLILAISKDSGHKNRTTTQKLELFDAVEMGGQNSNFFEGDLLLINEVSK
jgi:hypothetical protein